MDKTVVSTKKPDPRATEMCRCNVLSSASFRVCPYCGADKWVPEQTIEVK